ncbi:MAG: class I SAM-dependent methyltransferase [Clostridia bacterium]|nr:class I SAM-dependent methyltransferase [Clostridia bacterium]
MLALALRHTNKLIRRTVAESGIRLGRYFTPRAAAEEVAAILPVPCHEEVRILDAGAGTGILSAAAIETLCKAGGVRRILLDAYENDPRMIPTLADILERIRKRARHDYGVKLSVCIHEEDFLADAVGLAAPRGTGARYDLVLLSPPVGVPAEGSPAEAFCSRILPRGTDLAFLFAEAAAARLSEDGHMVAILPLSFADSVNAAPLRSRLFARAPLVSLTLDVGSRGERRDKTMLCLFRYGEEPEALRIRVAKDGVCEELPPIPYPVAVFSSEYKVLLTKTRSDIALVRAMNAFPCRLSDLGLCVRTGLCIETRYPECMRRDQVDGAIPLLHPAGLSDGQMHFPPRGREKPYIVPRIPSLAGANHTMVLVKRVPSRADGRHLVAGVYFSGQLPHDKRISTANKLNVIEGIDGEMEADLASGLCAVLSSSYYERYCDLTGSYRQVNAAALADLPLPPRETLLAIGRRLAVARNYSLKVADAVASTALSPFFVEI